MYAWRHLYRLLQSLWLSKSFRTYLQTWIFRHQWWSFKMAMARQSSISSIPFQIVLTIALFSQIQNFLRYSTRLPSWSTPFYTFYKRSQLASIENAQYRNVFRWSWDLQNGSKLIRQCPYSTKSWWYLWIIQLQWILHLSGDYCLKANCNLTAVRLQFAFKQQSPESFIISLIDKKQPHSFVW